jgi:hypothetical protein
MGSKGKTIPCRYGLGWQIPQFQKQSYLSKVLITNGNA